MSRSTLAFVLVPICINLSLVGLSDVANGSDPSKIKEEDIEYGLLELYHHPFGFPDIPQTRISGPHCISLLKEFADLEPVTEAVESLAEIGTVRIVPKEGKSIRFSWFFVGDKKTLLVAREGSMFRRVKRRVPGEESLVLDARQRKALKAADGKGETKGGNN